MNGDLLSLILHISAPAAGGLCGITWSPDFAHITLRAKAWRVLISMLVSLFVTPYLLHTFFATVHPTAVSFWGFAVSVLAFSVGPVVIKRVVVWSKRVNINLLPKDEA